MSTAKRHITALLMMAALVAVGAICLVAVSQLDAAAERRLQRFEQNAAEVDGHVTGRNPGLWPSVEVRFDWLEQAREERLAVDDIRDYRVNDRVIVLADRSQRDRVHLAGVARGHLPAIGRVGRLAALLGAGLCFAGLGTQFAARVARWRVIGRIHAAMGPPSRRTAARVATAARAAGAPVVGIMAATLAAIGRVLTALARAAAVGVSRVSRALVVILRAGAVGARWAGRLMARGLAPVGRGAVWLARATGVVLLSVLRAVARAVVAVSVVLLGVLGAVGRVLAAVALAVGRVLAAGGRVLVVVGAAVGRVLTAGGLWLIAARMVALRAVGRVLAAVALFVGRGLAVAGRWLVAAFTVVLQAIAVAVAWLGRATERVLAPAGGGALWLARAVGAVLLQARRFVARRLDEMGAVGGRAFGAVGFVVVAVGAVVRRGLVAAGRLLVAVVARMPAGRTLSLSVIAAAALALIVSLSLLGIGTWRERRFDGVAQALPGLVVAVGSPLVADVHVAFEGSPYTRVEQFKVLPEGGYRTGERVTVLVDRSDPALAHLKGEPGDFLSYGEYVVFVWGLLAAIVGLPAGGATLLYPRLRRRQAPKAPPRHRTPSRRRAPRPAPATAARIDPSTLGG